MTYLYILISHTDIIGICGKILRGGHDGKLDGALIAKGLVGPFPHGADFLDGRNTIVGDQDLKPRGK